MDKAEELYLLPGRNIRLSEFNALIGRCQLKHLIEYVQLRRSLAKIYYEMLSACSSILLVNPSVLETSSFWKFPISFSSSALRNKVREELSRNGIDSDSAYSPPLHLQPVMQKLFSSQPGDLPYSEDILSRHLCLPVHPRMTTDDIQRVACIIIDCCNQHSVI